ncbi:MAG: hypothetical protein ACKO6L_01140 [Flavobacteriales bacterium]
MGYTVKYTIAFLMIFLHVAQGVGQTLPMTSSAADLCKQGNLDAAWKKVEEARATLESKEAYYWYVRGFVQKEWYKSRESSLRESAWRDSAVASFVTCLNADRKGDCTSMSKLGIKYLGSTYYNDALTFSQQCDEATEMEVLNLFEKFEACMKYAAPEEDRLVFFKEVYRSLAQRYFTLWQADINRESYANAAIRIYKAILNRDDQDAEAWYNCAVAMYNQAVFRYRKLDANTDMFDMITIQEECVKLIKKEALPHMQHAYDLQPERGEFAKAMMYMHRALEHEKDVAYFRSEVERLIREGKFSQ